jgi:hypothetical protein
VGHTIYCNSLEVLLGGSGSPSWDVIGFEGTSNTLSSVGLEAHSSHRHSPSVTAQTSCLKPVSQSSWTSLCITTPLTVSTVRCVLTKRYLSISAMLPIVPLRCSTNTIKCQMSQAPTGSRSVRLHSLIPIPSDGGFTVLHPSMHVHYLQSAEWELSWIETTIQIPKRFWETNYKPVAPAQPVVPSVLQFTYSKVS